MPIREPYFMVTVEGEDVSHFVTSLSVREDDRRVDQCHLEMIDEEMVFCDAIQEGALVSVDLGYHEAGEHGVVMKGIITKVNFIFPDKGRPRMEIVALDESIQMALEEKRVLWNKDKAGKASEIVSAIISQHGLTEGKIKLDPDPKINHHYCFVQDGISDLLFLQNLASELECKCFYEYEGQNGKFYFVPEDMILRQVTNPLVYHDAQSNLLKFEALVHEGSLEHYALGQAVDPESGQIAKNPSKELEAPPDWSLNQDRISQARQKDSRIADTAEKIFPKAKGKRKSIFNTLKKPKIDTGTASRKKEKIEEENTISKIRKYGQMARGTSLGDFQIRAKSTIEIKGVAERFCGTWYVPTVTHVISAKGYVTNFECTR